MARAALGCRHPGPHLPWRVMAHVLRVPALQFSDPVAFGVPVERGDSASGPALILKLSTHRAMGAPHLIRNIATSDRNSGSRILPENRRECEERS